MEESRTRRSRRKPLVAVLTILLVIAVAASAVLFTKYRQLSSSNTKEERQQIIRTIQDVVALPDEQPTLSTVVDASKFTNPTLKARAKDGDKLLVYAKAKRLILYRPSTKKVIDMLTIQDKQPADAVDKVSAD